MKNGVDDFGHAINMKCKKSMTAISTATTEKLNEKNHQNIKYFSH